MKKIVLVILFATGIGAFVFAQKNSGAPDAAKAAFAKTYPTATKVKWEKEDGNYEVSFTLNNQPYSAIYDAKGLLQETEQEIKTSDLPVAVSTYMKDHYKNTVVKGAARITKADGTIVYEAEIKGKDVLFDANGKFLKEVKD